MQRIEIEFSTPAPNDGFDLYQEIMQALRDTVAANRTVVHRLLIEEVDA